MTINLSDNTPRVSYAVAEGVSQSAFTVSFEFFDNDDLNVYVDGTLKTLTTDYTVTGGDGSTGTVNFVSAVVGATGGSTVVITRDIDLDRTTDFPSSGPFNIASLNTELDRFVAIAADLKDQADRALQLTDYDSAVSLVLPNVNSRKGTVLAFNSTTGAVEAGPITTNVNQLADISDDIATLADIEDGTDATDAIQTVAGISSNVTTVAGNSSNVTTVAGISANVTTVAGISSDVTAVAGDATDIGTVATNIASVNTAATNIVDIQNASTNAATATTKAGEAATSASNAATSETNAATSATNAAASAASAAASFDAFDDIYLGAKASAPTVDNDGDALTNGDLYFDTGDNELYIWNGSAWQAASPNIVADTTPQLGGNLDTNGNDITFGDNDKAIFGAGSDLQIYHDASNSIINDNGTGSLKLQTGGSTKVEVTSGGIDVTGTVTADGLTVDTNTLYVDSTNNRVGVGTASPSNPFQVGTSDLIVDSSGNVGIGTSSPSELIHGNGTSVSAVLLTTDTYTNGTLFKVQGDGSSFIYNRENSFLRFGTNDLERMRIDSSGNLLFEHTDFASGWGSTNRAAIAVGGNYKFWSSRDSTTSRGHMIFYNPNGAVGSIATSGSSTAFNTSSDHRLKENVTDVTDGITRVKQLAPKRFNFIADPDTTVDGFLAHQAQAVVPEAVTGTHNEVDDDGNAVMQGIDQSKLVPLLTAALKESIAKIEALEARVTALEGN